MSEIGETLRERRMALKIDVHDVEEATKIRAKYLRALENEEYNLLPGNAYVKSFLRTYADYLGLDSRELVDQYRTKAPQQDDEPMVYTPKQEGRRGPSGRWILLIAAIVLIVVVIFLVGVIGGSGGS